MPNYDFKVMGATRGSVGLSQITRLVPTDHLYGYQIKILAGSGTLEIVDPCFSGSSTAAAVGWGQGYPLGAGEIFSVTGDATTYLAATGATMQYCMILGRTAGATIL